MWLVPLDMYIFYFDVILFSEKKNNNNFNGRDTHDKTIKGPCLYRIIIYTYAFTFDS